jgi:hypothetical protein
MSNRICRPCTVGSCWGCYGYIGEGRALRDNHMLSTRTLSPQPLHNLAMIAIIPRTHHPGQKIIRQRVFPPEPRIITKNSKTTFFRKRRVTSDSHRAQPVLPARTTASYKRCLVARRICDATTWDTKRSHQVTSWMCSETKSVAGCSSRCHSRASCRTGAPSEKNIGFCRRLIPDSWVGAAMMAILESPMLAQPRWRVSCP